MALHRIPTLPDLYFHGKGPMSSVKGENSLYQHFMSLSKDRKPSKHQRLIYVAFASKVVMMESASLQWEGQGCDGDGDGDGDQRQSGPATVCWDQEMEIVYSQSSIINFLNHQLMDDAL